MNTRNVLSGRLGYSIIIEPPWFIRSNYPISYTLYICHAIWKYINDHRDLEQDLRQDVLGLLNQIRESLENGLYLRSNDFIEIIPFVIESENGFALIDRTRGCYPLVLFPDNYHRNEENESIQRTTAFILRLSDILKSFEDVINVITNSAEWTEATQANIFSILPFEITPNSQT